jgi:crossover junction endodeoxyribonuclease RuvC
VTRVLAIDPGSVSAAFAVLDTATGAARVDDVPVANKMVDAVGWAAAVREARPDVAIVELVSARPEQGARSGFRFGQGVGLLRGVVSALGIPLHEVSANKWKRASGLDSDKERARAMAIRLFPAVSGLGRKKDHGRAEALLLARWFAEHGVQP